MSTKEPNLQESNVRQVQAQLDEYIAMLTRSLEYDPADPRRMFALGKVSGLEYARDALDDMWQVVETIHANRRVGA
ncbi:MULTISPECIES: hypothetical protein [Corynebacterium]|uniref:Uncharacterized protein n=1 Tax=Corynebacterium hadale TaxID=2026255 RepID=A0A269PFT3_9CORY|nr:hypothetical protein [Corynebacterium hadale]PAJ70932.1 hypothetical protein CIG21_01750 [Corynebacterium hadale]WKC60807.1 hypothetical protein CHAD_09770 [Corynebacterium hadale]